MNQILRRLGIATAFSIATVAFMGCSSKFAPEEKLAESGVSVTGTVKYKGEKVEYAMIRIKGNDREATGKVGSDGTFVVNNCPPGEVKIGVNTAAARGDYQTVLMAGGKYTGPDGKEAKKVSMKFVDVPEKYADPETSGLKATLKPGTNTHDIVIE